MFKLNNQLHNPTNNFLPKNCLFGIVKLKRRGIKSRFIYNGQVITFDGTGQWSYGNYFPQNVIVFSFDKSSSFYTDNQKNGFFSIKRRIY